jgi:hypothetical protein
MRWRVWALVALLGCDGGEQLDLLETGWFDDSDVVGDTEVGACLGRLVDVQPVDGDDDWFWRTAPQIAVESVSSGYAVRLSDALGRSVPTQLVPVDEVGLKLEARFEGGLAPNTEYVLEVQDCFETRTVRFRTSAYGTPLAGGGRALLGRTYSLDLVGAEWVEPGGFGPILATSFNTPVLLGVRYADQTHMDWIGATGYTIVGLVKQDVAYPTWDFPLTGFDESPYFETTSEQVVLVVSGYELPVSSFLLSGTLASDGSHFAGGRLQGLGDTRYAGGAIAQPNNPAAMCTLAAGIGVQCAACPDGEPYCLRVDLRDLDAIEIDGLTLVPVLPEP